MSVPTLSQIVEIADRLFPFESAETWDNCGIQIGDPHRSIRAVAFSLDATPQTVQFAADRSCDLLVTHHPVLLEPLRRIVPDNLSGRTLLRAARMDVDILSLHTNLDAADGGLNDELAALIGLQDVITPLPARCARLGCLSPPRTVRDLAGKILSDLGIESVRVIAETDPFVRRVFCVTGSGMGYLKDAMDHQADVLLTGDVRYHAAREAAEMGMPVIDAGHWALEKIAVPLLVRSFQGEFRVMGLDVACIGCNLEGEPFTNIYKPQGGISVERADSTS
ncbi:MAG: Nif3-like dinuclear metal center hexameric protein [Desulfomonile tiedjei]|nr:Nif3-like dinuclear metal center hexameric protein [Desulfomonile tiedjei]